jgi:hypothetical protein
MAKRYRCFAVIRFAVVYRAGRQIELNLACGDICPALRGLSVFGGPPRTCAGRSRQKR